eukprot:5966985-Pyramimonas_sp.AAC.1
MPRYASRKRRIPFAVAVDTPNASKCATSFVTERSTHILTGGYQCQKTRYTLYWHSEADSPEVYPPRERAQEQ